VGRVSEAAHRVLWLLSRGRRGRPRLPARVVIAPRALQDLRAVQRRDEQWLFVDADCAQCGRPCVEPTRAEVARHLPWCPAVGLLCSRCRAAGCSCLEGMGGG
jgi:hypothetical protein